MAEISPRNLQVRLLILVFLAFLPAMVIFFYASLELRKLQLEAREQELVRRAQVTAAEYRSMLAQDGLFLAALAEFPEIRSARAPTCTEYLERVLEHTEHLTTISMIGLDGYLACGAVTPGEPLYLGDRAYFVRATSREIFSVGEFALGRITGKSVVGMAYPIMDGNQVKAVLAASLDLSILGGHPWEEPLPPGYTLTVLDRKGLVLVRLPVGGDFTLADSVGSVAGEGFPGLPDSEGPVTVMGTDLDGVDRFFAVTALRSPRGTVEGYLAIGRTGATLLEEVDHIVGLQLRFLAVGGALLLFLAWVLGHFWLTRPPRRAAEP